MKTIGLDSWSRFLADAQDRARDPDTVAAVEKSRRPPDPAKDAIRPSTHRDRDRHWCRGYRGGGAARLRAAGGALLRQVLPKAGSRTGNAAEEPGAGAATAERPTGTTGSGGSKSETGATNSPPRTERTPISRQKQDGHIHTAIFAGLRRAGIA